MKSNPLVSVVLPIFNSELPLLKRAVQSVLDQTYKNFELIVVNEDHQREVKDLLAAFATEDARVKVFNLLHGKIYHLF